MKISLLQKQLFKDCPGIAFTLIINISSASDKIYLKIYIPELTKNCP